MVHFVHACSSTLSHVKTDTHSASVTAIGSRSARRECARNVESANTCVVRPVSSSNGERCVDTVVMGGVATVVIPVCHSSLRQSRHLNHIAIAHGIALSDSVCSHIVDCSRLHVHPVDTSVVFQIFCCAVVEHCRIWFCAPAESLFENLRSVHTAYRHTSECSDGSTHIALVCNYGRNGSCRVGEVILKRSLLEFGNLNLHFLKCSVEIVVHCLRSVDYAKELLRPLHFAFSISIFCHSNGCRKFFVGSDRQLNLIDSLAERC